MKTKLLFSLTALIAGIAGWGIASGSFRTQAAHAATGYSLASVKGTYGYIVQGQMGNNNPIVAIGILAADGIGGVSGTETLQTIGTYAEPQAFQGSYTVDRDGSGTLVLNFPAGAVDSAHPDAVPTQGATVRYRFVIVNNKVELKGVRADNRSFATASFSLQ